jgi:ABC-type nitrate/sulfonate/bicarbonate transport system substrate-binding protein
VTDQFAKKHPELVTKFLKVMNDSTLYFFKNPEESYKLIGEKAALTPEKTRDIMKTMGFYAKED